MKWFDKTREAMTVEMPQNLGNAIALPLTMLTLAIVFLGIAVLMSMGR